MLADKITDKGDDIHLAGRAMLLGAVEGPNSESLVNDGLDHHPQLCKTINGLVSRAAARLDAAFKWTTLQINFGTTSGWHTDSFLGPALLFALGHYEEGFFELQGVPPWISR